MGISPDYASPGLRWGLLLEDYPGAEASYHVDAGTAVGVHPSKGGADEFIICTITFPPETNRKPAIGYKPLETHPVTKEGNPKRYDHDSDLYKENCTKAKGRALTEAGYPADVIDLKALSVWRRQNKQIEALAAGKATVALEPAKAETAIAGTSEPEQVSPDEVAAPLQSAPDAPAPPQDESLKREPTEETLVSLRAAVNALGNRSPELTKWARKQGYRVTRPHNEGEAQALISQARSMLGDQDDVVAEPDETAAQPEQDGQPDQPAQDVQDVQDEQPGQPGEEPAGQVETVRELLAGLDDGDRHAFEVFAKNVGADPTKDPAEWDPDAVDIILGWLAVG